MNTSEKDILYELYIVKKLSRKQIAVELGLTIVQVN